MNHNSKLEMSGRLPDSGSCLTRSIPARTLICGGDRCFIWIFVPQPGKNLRLQPLHYLRPLIDVMIKTLKMQYPMNRKMSIVRGKILALPSRLVFYHAGTKHDVASQGR